MDILVSKTLKSNPYLIESVRGFCRVDPQDVRGGCPRKPSSHQQDDIIVLGLGILIKSFFLDIHAISCLSHRIFLCHTKIFLMNSAAHVYFDHTFFLIPQADKHTARALCCIEGGFRLGDWTELQLWEV